MAGCEAERLYGEELPPPAALAPASVDVPMDEEVVEDDVVVSVLVLAGGGTTTVVELEGAGGLTTVVLGGLITVVLGEADSRTTVVLDVSCGRMNIKAAIAATKTRATSPITIAELPVFRASISCDMIASIDVALENTGSHLNRARGLQNRCHKGFRWLTDRGFLLQMGFLASSKPMTTWGKLAPL